VCELYERDTCFEDCHRYDSVPASWMEDSDLGLLASRREAGAPSGSGCAVGSHERSRLEWRVGAGLALLLVTGAAQVRRHSRRERRSPARDRRSPRPERCLSAGRKRSCAQ
jgi:hypothetical protein